MAIGGYRLGVDFGTSSTVAVIAGPEDRARPLLFDASPLLPSGVSAEPGTDQLLTGADAERAALVHPAGFEANPKRRIDDGVIWLAEREVAVADATAAVLARVGAEAARVAGGPPAAVVLTHPAAWSRTRLAVLAAAAQQAQLDGCVLVAEPVAAAAYFADVLGRDLPAGRCLVVYDLGAGTCDVSVVRRAPDGLETLTSAGLDDVGGLDLDALVVRHARSLTATATDAWGRLEWPRNPADQQARHLLWQGARAAKEQLSRHAAAELRVPLVDTVVRMTREELEAAARPLLERTTDLTTRVLRNSGISRQDIAGVFLVGGSSRVPLVASLLHRSLGIAPTALDHPELVVAEGALHALPTGRDAPEAGPAVPTPADTPQTEPTVPTPTDTPQTGPTMLTPADAPQTGPTVLTPTDAPPRPARAPRDGAVAGSAVALALLIILAAGLWFSRPHEPDQSADTSTTQATTASSDRRTTPAAGPATTAATDPASTAADPAFTAAGPASMDSADTDRTAFTVDALLPLRFTDDKDIEFARMAASAHPCDQEAGGQGPRSRSEVVAELTSHGCQQVMTGVYLEQPGPSATPDNPVLVSVAVFALPDQAKAGDVYNYLNNTEARWNLTTWCTETGYGAKPCVAGSKGGLRTLTDRVFHRYVITAIAERTDLTNDGTIQPWLASASNKASASSGPQN